MQELVEFAGSGDASFAGCISSYSYASLGWSVIEDFNLRVIRVDTAGTTVAHYRSCVYSFVLV